jgi:ATP-dependent Zn protease
LQALGFAQYVPSDRYLHSREELEDRIVVMLGGRAAEQVTFGKVTTGASDDLKRVTELAYAMYTTYGMSPSIGTLQWGDFPKPEVGYRSSSNAFASTVEGEVKELVARAYARSVGLLEEHQTLLVLLAEKLLEEEVLTYDQVEAVVGPRPFECENPLALKDEVPEPRTAEQQDEDEDETSAKK